MPDDEYIVVKVPRCEIGWISLALDNWRPASNMDRPEGEYGQIRKKWDEYYRAFHDAHLPAGVRELHKVEQYAG